VFFGMARSKICGGLSRIAKVDKSSNKKTMDSRTDTKLLPTARSTNLRIALLVFPSRRNARITAARNMVPDRKIPRMIRLGMENDRESDEMIRFRFGCLLKDENI